MVTGGGGGGGVGGGEHFSKMFSILYMLNSKNIVFNPFIFNWYLSNEKTVFVDKSRVEPTIFFHRKNIIFFETFLWSFFVGNPLLRLSEVLC